MSLNKIQDCFRIILSTARKRLRNKVTAATNSNLEARNELFQISK